MRGSDSHKKRRCYLLSEASDYGSGTAQRAASQEDNQGPRDPAITVDSGTIPPRLTFNLSSLSPEADRYRSAFPQKPGQPLFSAQTRPILLFPAASLIFLTLSRAASRLRMLFDPRPSHFSDALPHGYSRLAAAGDL